MIEIERCYEVMRKQADEIEQLRSRIHHLVEEIAADYSEPELRLKLDQQRAENAELRDCNGQLKALMEESESTKNTPPSDELTICGMRVTLVDTENDNEVAFVQGGKVVGRIVLEKDND